MEKRVYEFTADEKACVIREPKLPRYWFNYLWSEKGYCAQVSQNGHGRSYYLNEKADMCMLNNNDARYVYIRDEDSKKSWNIGAAPLNEEIGDFQCVHQLGYSELTSKTNGIEAGWKIYVPSDGYQEVWMLRLKNTENSPRNLSVFEATSFELEGFFYPRYYENYRCMETHFKKELNGIYCSSNHPFAPHKRYNAYLAASEPVFAYDGDLSKFCGGVGTITKLDASAYALFQRPDVVVSGRDCTNSEAALFVLGAVLQHKFTLQPGEEKEIYVVMGVCESPEEAAEIHRKYSDKEAVYRGFEQAVTYNEEKYSTLKLDTPDPKVNHIMKQWIKKQVDCCIVGKKGVRDNLQIAVALLNYRQEKAKEEILECLRHQFSDGHAVLTWYPYDDTRYSDQPFWIIWAVCELLKETGDMSLLDKQIAWQDGGEATVREHLKAAVSCLIRDKGKNGLVKIYFADWNDALNITTDPEAESVMLSEQFCLALTELEYLMRYVGDGSYADFLHQEYEKLSEAINERAWDGSWYMRALSDVENIGSKDSEGSKIYLNVQTWAILADIVPESRKQDVIAAVDGMEQDFGFPLNLPPYEHYSPNVGRMSGMLPGLFENGGVYCHATSFKIFMDCRLGRADKAIRTLKKIMPDSTENPSMNSGAEPYVFTNCYATHPGYYGKSYWSWTTGTSAWALRSIYEGIMGVKRSYEGLCIEPCFPSEWEKAEVTRRFRNADYHICIENPKHLENGKAQIVIDGKLLVGNVLPNLQDGRMHEVHVTLG